jgi:hypothetical protein
MPIDIDRFLVKADHDLIRKAQRRGGDKAARKMIEAISRRVGKTTFEANQKVARELCECRSRVS